MKTSTTAHFPHDPRLLYPFLFAPLRVVYTAAHNAPGTYLLSDVFWVWADLVCITAALYAVLYVGLRGRWSAQQIALLCMAGVAWFWGYPPAFWRLTNSGARIGPAFAHVLLLGCGSVLTAGLLIWLSRHVRVRDRVTTLLASMGVILMGWSALGILKHEIVNATRLQRSALVAELRHGIPQPAPGSPQINDPRPDIYLVILDMYANGAVMREYEDFDNHAFEDSLQQLGFTIPAATRSNYSHTRVSLPSLLNFAYLTNLTDVTTSIPHYLVSHNRAVEFLKRQGYRFVFMPSQWWLATQHNPYADVTLGGWHGWSAGRALSSSPLRWALLPKTLFAFTPLGGPEPYASYVRETFDQLVRSQHSTTPTFVLAHVMSPHPPYVFDPRCRPKPWLPPGSPTPQPRVAYLEQIQCLNRLVLGFVRAVLSRPGPRPVIILQGDHGPQFLGSLDVPSLDRLTPDQLRERLGAFGAYYEPDDGDRDFRSSVTLVNVLPLVFNRYFHAMLPLQPDRFYMWNTRSDTVWKVPAGLLARRAHRRSGRSTELSMQIRSSSTLTDDTARWVETSRVSATCQRLRGMAHMLQ